MRGSENTDQTDSARYKICVVTSLPRTDTKDRDGWFAGTYNADAAYRRRRFDFSSWRAFWFSIKYCMVKNLFVGCDVLGVESTNRERDRGWRVFVPAFRLGEVFPVQMLEPGNKEDDRCEEVGFARKPFKFGGYTYRLFDLADILDAIELSYDIVDLKAWLGSGRSADPAFPLGVEFDSLVKRMRANWEDRP